MAKSFPTVGRCAQWILKRDAGYPNLDAIHYPWLLIQSHVNHLFDWINRHQLMSRRNLPSKAIFLSANNGPKTHLLLLTVTNSWSVNSHSAFVKSGVKECSCKINLITSLKSVPAFPYFLHAPPSSLSSILLQEPIGYPKLYRQEIYYVPSCFRNLDCIACSGKFHHLALIQSNRSDAPSAPGKLWYLHVINAKYLPF